MGDEKGITFTSVNFHLGICELAKPSKYQDKKEKRMFIATALLLRPAITFLKGHAR